MPHDRSPSTQRSLRWPARSAWNSSATCRRKYGQRSSAPSACVSTRRASPTLGTRPTARQGSGHASTAFLGRTRFAGGSLACCGAAARDRRVVVASVRVAARLRGWGAGTVSRQRSFDYDEANRLRGEGLTYQAISERLGVSNTAVQLACKPAARANANANHAEWQRQGKCVDCGGPCTRQGGLPAHRCVTCFALAIGTTAREGELECSRCKEWKADAAFPHNRTEKIARRGRHGVCRSCQAEMRRKARHSRRVPCLSCGEPCAHPDDSRYRTGLCVHCVRARKRVAA